MTSTTVFDILSLMGINLSLLVDAFHNTKMYLFSLFERSGPTNPTFYKHNEKTLNNCSFSWVFHGKLHI